MSGRQQRTGLLSGNGTPGHFVHLSYETAPIIMGSVAFLVKSGPAQDLEVGRLRSEEAGLSSLQQALFPYHEAWG